MIFPFFVCKLYSQVRIETIWNTFIFINFVNDFIRGPKEMVISKIQSPLMILFNKSFSLITPLAAYGR